MKLDATPEFREQLRELMSAAEAHARARDGRAYPEEILGYLQDAADEPTVPHVEKLEQRRPRSRGITVADLFPAAADTGVTDRERSKWLSLRRKLLTASRTAALFDEHPFTNRLELYADMVLDNPPEEIVSIDSPMFWGKALEEAIFRSASEYYGWEHCYGGQLLQSRQHPFLGATLDGAVRPDGYDWIVYEGKTTSMFRSKEWSEDTGAMPTHVLIQVQHQLLVTGADAAIVFCLIGGQKPVKVEVTASAAFHAAIVEEAEQFLELVKKLEPPPADGSAASTRALDQLYPSGEFSGVRLPKEAIEWTREYQESARLVRELGKRQDEIKNQLKAHIGKATHGLLAEPVGDKSCWRWIREGAAAGRLTALKNTPRRIPMLEAANTHGGGLLRQQHTEESIQ